MAQKINNKEQYLKSCYQWARKVFGDSFEELMCDVCAEILRVQYDNDGASFDEAGLELAFPGGDIPECETDFQRCVQAALMWNKIDNESMFI